MQTMTHSGTNVQPRPLLITVGIHALLLLILLLWKFTLPAQPQPVAESGMEVNLGTSDNGSGADQPMDVEDPAATASRSRSAAAAGGTADVERGTEEDAPSVLTGTHNARNNVQTPQMRAAAGDRADRASQQAVQTRQPRFIYNGNNGKGGNSASANIAGTGEGITGRPGDQGVPQGTPGATNYSGTPGNGTGGYSFSLGGRSIERAPTSGEQFREGGKVVVHVTVNREGEIVNKRVTSSTNTELSPIALRRLQSVRFNKSETAPEEQFGTITFVFKTRQ